MTFVRPVLSVALAAAVTMIPAVGAQTIDRIDALAQKMLSRPIAGISIAVGRDGRVEFARGYGMANLEHSVPVSSDTVFHIASISKHILAAVLLQLVDQGSVNLDADVTEYLPEAPTQKRKVTVRQLLNHTSGIYSFTSLPDAEANERLDATHEQVLAWIKDKPFDFEPGTSWRYDNSAFYIAGMVVERVTHQEYGAYVRQHVFEPLGMESARMCDARMVVPHLASGYERQSDTLLNAAFLTWKLPFAAGAICATASDIVKWEAALDAGRVLSPASLALMRTPTTLSDGTQIDYGLGTRLGALDGHRVVGHTGSGGGYAAALESFPNDHVTVVVLINTGVGAGPALSLAAAVARSWLHLSEKQLPKDLVVPEDELAALPGIFESDEGTVENFARGGKLLFRSLPSGAEGPMSRQSSGVYAVTEDIEVHFLTRNGRASWASVYTGGLFMDAKRRVGPR